MGMIDTKCIYMRINGMKRDLGRYMNNSTMKDI